MKRPIRSERVEQRYVAALYRKAGCHVYWLSQPRASQQTPGLPDLFVIGPSFKGCWWHEVKRDGGRQRVEQAQFEQRLRDAGVRVAMGGPSWAQARFYVLGGTDAAITQLVELGLLAAEARRP